MKKYRVVTNGQTYKVQVKSIFGWKDFKFDRMADDGSGYYKERIEMANEEGCWTMLDFILNPVKNTGFSTVVSEREL